MGHYEVAPYFLKNEHTRVPEIQIASRAALEKLAELDSSFPGIVRGCAGTAPMWSAASGPSGKLRPKKI